MMLKNTSPVVLTLLAMFAVLAVAGAHAGSAPAASTAVKCNLAKDGRKLGATYVTSLSTTKVTCVQAKAL